MRTCDSLGGMHKGDARATWLRFVYDVVAQDSQSEIARRTGIPQATISRWLSEQRRLRPTPEKVIMFARGYGVNPVVALVAAGLITDNEARLPRERVPHLSTVPTSRLIAELARRDRAQEVVA